MSRHTSVPLHKPPPEPLMLKRLHEGDERAYTELYKRHYDAVSRQAYCILLDFQGAEDVAQEVFSRLWIHRQRIAGQGRDTVLPYLLVAARNLSLNQKEQQERFKKYCRHHTYRYEYTEQPVMILEKKELTQQIHRALGCTTSKRSLRVVELVYLEEKDRQTVIAEMGNKYNTVKNQLRSGLEILRRQGARFADFYYYK